MKKLLSIGLPIVFVFAAQQVSHTQTASLLTIRDERDIGPRAGAKASVSNLPSSNLTKPSQPLVDSELRDAAARALKLVQHSQSVWYQKQTCTSCHHQLLPEIPLKLARERGVPIDEKIARESTANAFAYLKDLAVVVQGYDYIDAVADAWELVAAHAAGIAPTLTTSFEAQFIASRQLEDGSWPTIDQRPPQSHSTFSTTAVCAQAMRLYLPERLKTMREARLHLARNWFLKSQPQNTEDRTFQLFGLNWTGAGIAARTRAARALLAEQRADGGWAQLRERESDGYATGEVLVALHEAGGIPTSSPAFQRGLRFLLKTQEPDGYWRVSSRLHPPAQVSPPYVNVEFPPFQHDQFISAMATSWATAALLQAVPARPGEKRQALSGFGPAGEAEWMRVALDGSPAELRRLLDTGMKPDSRAADGTSALMLAARDPQKVKLLIDRGADVNARSSFGFTPLMVAARYRRNVEVVRLLLKAGAKPNAEKGIEVRNDATPLFFAVMAGDIQMTESLLAAGARLSDKMNILGTIPTSPLNYVTSLGDAKMVTYLIGKGANPNEVDDGNTSVLDWAAIANRTGVVEVLITKGANVNHVDKYGMTPLLYAASIDFGNTTVMKKLIAAGADVKAKNKEGLTALELANSFHHRTLATVLEAKRHP